MKKVQEASKGELVINYLGGPEVIASNDQLEAVRRGVVDMGINGHDIMAATEPVIAGVKLATASVQKLRNSEFYNFINGILSKSNIYHFGAADLLSSRVLFLNKRVEKLSDLTGLKVRAIGSEIDVAKALGMQPVSMTMGDVYNAAERGVINGIALSWASFVSYQWYEVMKYVLDHSYHIRGGLPLIMNLETLNGLPERLRKLLIDSWIQTEIEAEPLWVKLNDDARAKCIANGVKIITFSQEEGAQFVARNRDLSWEWINKKAPETGPKLRQLGEAK